MLHLCLPLLLACLTPWQESRPERSRPQRPKEPGEEREKPVPLVKLPEDFVQFSRVPDGGRLPRVALRGGQIALLYFQGKGEDAPGDLFVARSTDEGKSFTAGTRLNAEPGSVSALKGVGSGSIDLDPDGRAHVAWITGGDAPALMYAREASSGAFAPVELGSPPGLASSTAIAVDATGRVYLFHVAHAQAPENGNDPGFRVWVRRSTDEEGFTEPVAIDDAADGISAGSAIFAHVDDVTDHLLLIYRVATPKGDRVLRDVRLLASEDQGETFTSTLIERRKQNNDPCAHASLAQEIQTSIAAWEMLGHVSVAVIHRKTKKIAVPITPRDDENEFWRSRPVAAANGNELIMAWLEQPAADRKSPPSLRWQVWYREGLMPLGDGRAPELPGDTHAAIIPRAQGGFTILY